MGSSTSSKGGKGTGTSQAWRNKCVLRTPSLNCKHMLMREAGQTGVGWKKGVLVHHSDQTHSHLIEQRSYFWLALAHSPDEPTCGFPINCCCLWFLWFKRGADYVFHHINSSETHDEVPRSFLGPAALPARFCGWRAHVPSWHSTVSLPHWQWHMASSSPRGPIVVMTTLGTGWRDKCRLHKPPAEFSRRMEPTGIPSFTDCFFS